MICETFVDVVKVDSVKVPGFGVSRAMISSCHNNSLLANKYLPLPDFSESNSLVQYGVVPLIVNESTQ